MGGEETSAKEAGGGQKNFFETGREVGKKRHGSSNRVRTSYRQGRGKKSGRPMGLTVRGQYWD